MAGNDGAKIETLEQSSKARVNHRTYLSPLYAAQALGLINIPIGGHDDYVNDRSDVEAVRKLIEINKYQEEEADA